MTGKVRTIAVALALVTPPAAGAACRATRVHYEPHVGAPQGLKLPWIAAEPLSSRLIGYLFYYSPNSTAVLFKTPSLTIFTHGTTPSGEATKIMWMPGRFQNERLITLVGRRLDGPGSFRQRITGGSYFPSVPNVPHAGCWRLTLRYGKIVGRITVRAVDAR